MRETRPASDLPPWAGNELGKVHPGGLHLTSSLQGPGWPLGSCQSSALMYWRDDGGDDNAEGHHTPLEMTGAKSRMQTLTQLK